MEVGGDFPTEVNKRASSPSDSAEESNVSKSNVVDNSLVTSEQAAQTGVNGSIENGGLSPTQSPSIQTMDRSEGYDPNRIPASVFSSKPATPMEWSVASSESLFSIHVGNPSFTTEFAQLSKSGELTKSQELIPPSALLPVNEAAADKEKGSLRVRETLSAEATKEVSRESAEDHVKGKMPPHAEGFRNSVSSLPSDGSINSTLSFAFPVLEFDGGRSSSIKVYPEKQQQQQQVEQPQPLPNAPEATQNATATKWFPCFSCCSFCF